ALQGSVSLGELALVYAAFNQGQRLIRIMLENVGQLYANSLFLGNLFEFLSLRTKVIDVAPSLAKKPLKIAKEISFEDVTFKYPDSSTRALESFNMSIPAGKIVSIVGPNGAGKSTLVKLLCRFYDPDQGGVTIDGANLKEIPLAHLRRLITVLFQQPFHYNDTVEENVQYGEIDSEPSQVEIELALHAAGADEIVARLPAGSQTLLGKWFKGGVGLSVGEW